MFVARAEAQVGLEMAGKTSRIGEVETVAARVDVLVEGVFVVGWREYRVVHLQQAAKLAHGLRLVGVLETEFHLSLAVEFHLQSPTIIPTFQPRPVTEETIEAEPSRKLVVGADAETEIKASIA